MWYYNLQGSSQLKGLVVPFLRMIDVKLFKLSNIIPEKDEHVKFKN